MSNASKKLGGSSFRLGVNPVPEQLCESCRSFSFEKSGSILGRSLNEDYRTVTQKVSAALASSGRCFICNEVASLFDQFEKSHRGKGMDIDPQETQLRMDFYNCIFSFNKEVDPPRPNGTMRRLQLRLLFENPKKRSERLGLSATFQKCSPQPGHVDSICATSSLTDWVSEDTRPYEGRLRPLTANPDLFLKWKETCRLMHETRCINPSPSTILTNLRSVDVKRRCIVDGQLGDKYVALSYLWGQSPSREDHLCNATISSFYQPSSLRKGCLPATMEDAITLTMALREDNLWIDRLCIKQDDVDDKARFVPRMHEIYGSAELTIIAAAGVDADAGLPGIRPETRKIQQKVVILEGIAMMESLDPQPAAHSLKGSTSYNTRAWCFQERCAIYHH